MAISRRESLTTCLQSRSIMRMMIVTKVTRWFLFEKIAPISWKKVNIKWRIIYTHTLKSKNRYVLFSASRTAHVEINDIDVYVWFYIYNFACHQNIHTYIHTRTHTRQKRKFPVYGEIKKNSRGTFSKRMCIYVSCVLHVFFYTFPFLVDTRLCFLSFIVCVGKNPSQIHLFVHKIGQLRNNTRGLPCRCGSGRDKVIYAAF